MKDRKVAIIPAYEPGPEMGVVACALAGEGFEVVIVDDGSSESCRTAFDEARAHATVLVHEANRGKGEAIKTGLRYAMGEWGQHCVIATVDADGQHRVEDVLKVSAEAARHPGSLVLGSRAFEGEVPWRSRLGNGITRGVFRLVSGRRVRDTQTGLRAFSGDLAPHLAEVAGSRYEYETNALLECVRAGVPLREVGIRTIYVDGNAASHFNPVRDSALIYFEILKFSASSLASFAIDYALFCLLLAITGAPIAANIGARVASASANYAINRNLVFKSSAAPAKSLAQYAALAIGILACNSIALGLLTAWGANPYIAKVIVEVTLFAVSYAVQHSVIFRKERQSHEKAYLGYRV